MAATRKLQGEIERCLKKVTEGVETFEDIWQKVHNATNSNQKEKYEADLKKEIKKLQRLRDQIKSWIASAEIKDKSALLDYRKLIETQMERFKVVERETKTKAYSKEGLGAAQKMDPAQKEKEEISAWLVQSIDALNLQLDQFESEIESLLAGKKKRLDKDKQDRMDDLKAKLEKHRYHIRKLETLLRMLDNMSVEVIQIRGIKDDVEYYIESSQDPDFEGNEYIYDDIIGLDEIELSGVGQPSSATTDSNGTPTSITSSPPPSPPLSGSTSGGLPSTTVPPMTTQLNHSSDNSSNEEKRRNSDQIPQKVVVKPMAVRASSNNSTASVLNCNNTNNSSLAIVGGGSAAVIVGGTPVAPTVGSSGSSTVSGGKLINNSTSITTSSTTTVVNNNNNNTSNSSNKSTSFTTPNNCSPSSGQQNSAPSSASATNNTHPSNFAAVAAQHNKHSNISGTENGVTNSSEQSSNINHTTGGGLSGGGSIGPVSSTPVPPTMLMNNNNNSGGESSSSPPSSVSSAPSPAPVTPPTPPPAPSIPAAAVATSSTAVSAAVITTTSISNTPQDQPSLSTLKSIAQQVIDRAGLDISTSEPTRPGTYENKSNNTGEAEIPPLLGVAPLGPVPLQKEHQCQFQMMEAAYYHMPHPADSERVRQYLPRTPCHTPVYHHQVPLAHSDTLEFFQRLSTETLFFIFYYMEGSKAQYLAAKALKKQSWRFHTKYMMWFQRHEEPKLINEEYEQGTYIYFDYEKWGQRKKEGFTFEYKYLEDRDLN